MAVTYIILLPYSNTNATSNYLVVDNAAWMRFVNKEIRVYPIAKTCKTYGEAEEARAALYQQEVEYW